MRRVFGLALVGLVLALPVFGASDDGLNGNWKLTTLAPTGTTETTNWVLKLETKDGKTTAKIVAANPTLKAPEVASFTVSGDHVRVILKGNTGKATVNQVFEGHITKDSKKIVGVVGGAAPAYMAPTDLKELDPTDIAGKVTADDLKVWAALASRMAAEHKAAWTTKINVYFTEVFLKTKKADLAVEYAMAAEKSLDSKSPAEAQASVLETIAKALKAAGKTAELAMVTERLEKLEKALDEEYLTKVPPFKGQPFGGRKGQSKRVVVMELFTGAQCNPCIAADVAFDVLSKTYKDTELALIQYHMHIPGPDPMTNDDTEARWKYYRDAHGPKAVSGTPSTLFNGFPKAGGGGAMAAAEKKYAAYTGIIDPLLEDQADCKVTATAKRVGDKVIVKTGIDGLAKAGKDMKLRIVLVEETVRFVGSNKLRFHHHVVRAMPGGADGVAISKELFSSENVVDLGDLRKKLTTYLDNYAENNRPFPQPGRPMNMNHLRVIAFVQNDATFEIVQAVQVNVVE